MKESLEWLTPLYGDLDIQYQQEYSGPYKSLCYQDDDCIVIAAEKDKKITGFGRPVVMVGTDKALRKQIERLYDISEDIWLMDFLENNRLSTASKFLMQDGLIAEPYFTQVIDLRKTEEQLHSQIRKSYKSLCNKSEVEFSVVEVLKNIHKEMHGKETRNSETWKLQDKMVSSGNAFVLGDKAETAAALFYYNKHSAYYACSASRDEGKTHPIIWQAIKILKEKGCKTLELGEQHYFGHEKNVNISRFKSGFGGASYSRLIIKQNKWKETEDEQL